MENVTTIYARIENRPGALERLTRVLADRNVNVEAFAVETNGPIGFVRLLAQRPRENLEALRAAGIEAYESPALVVALPNRPGELADATRELAAAGVNVEAASVTPDGKVLLRTHDNALATQVLKKL